MTDATKPGDRITVTGIYKVRNLSITSPTPKPQIMAPSDTRTMLVRSWTHQLCTLLCDKTCGLCLLHLL